MKGASYLLPLLAASLASAASINQSSLFSCSILTEHDAKVLESLDLDVWNHRIRVPSHVDVRTQSISESFRLQKVLKCALKMEDVYNTSTVVNSDVAARQKFTCSESFGLCNPGSFFGDSCGSNVCAELVKETDSHCALFGWDEVCVSLVSTVCGLDCTLVSSGKTEEWKQSLDELDVSVKKDKEDRMRMVNMKAAVQKLPAADVEFFKNYQSYETIVAKMQEWSRTYANLTTFVPSIGKSIEGRDIPAMIVTDPSVPVSKKRMVYWNGGQHAREWISPATVMYLLSSLLSNAPTSPVSTYLTQLQIVFTPISNPDGYTYTRSTDRMWRKNRRRNSDGTFGVDLNRNWDDHWGGEGSSGSTRSDTYRGPRAFSEPETKAVSDYILSFPNRLAGIDFHSFSQIVMRNYGFTSRPSKNEAILKKMGDGMAAAIKKTSGVVYTSEKGAELYVASGCTDDWFTNKAGMNGWTIELRDKGANGFKLPPAQIVPTGEEIWNAMLYFLEFILTNSIPQNAEA
ncbi:hypothetical protein HDV05_000465 [Chytridiales sp. JEL 0842]|nr:hypothetical protein HDV05_000465 [Chytridiales sp. JEL 0842]